MNYMENMQKTMYEFGISVDKKDYLMACEALDQIRYIL